MRKRILIVILMMSAAGATALSSDAQGPVERIGPMGGSPGPLATPVPDPFNLALLAEPASSAYSVHPFIEIPMMDQEIWALSAGFVEYFQIRIPYRPIYFSPIKPRDRRTRRLADNPLPFSPTECFGQPTEAIGWWGHAARP